MVKLPKYQEFLRFLSLVLGILFFIAVIIFFAAFISIIFYNFSNEKIVVVFDEYARLILTSWPASVLIIGLLLLFKQHESISHFIKHRMTKLGLDGVSGDVVTTDASPTDLQVKNVGDAQDEHELNKTTVDPTSIVIEEGVSRNLPNTFSEAFYERYKKRVEIEDMVQTLLISEFKERYRLNVKLSSKLGRPLILDGLLTTYAGGLRAVEIKYISKDNHPALRFVLARLQEKLELFGIKKLMVIIVADNLTENEAVEINKKLSTVRATKYFFSLFEGKLVEVPFPPKMKRLIQEEPLNPFRTNL